MAAPEFGPVSLVLVRMGVSALLWGYLLLGEVLSLQILVGMAITLAGTAIATGLLRLRRPGRGLDCP
ncbi:hypothetical protein [Halomonas sp. BM-2019]|uniref:hypothetical protein n=1 Tax=Halomonas sp. BM-2019 TaxID=2811227 RepID=UPI001B3C3F68|nr:MAG: hypothetical protein J5F18_07495 [Halomonas sp. BM-2019]